MERRPKSAETFVCTLDVDGRFTSITPEGEAITGYPAADLLGRFASDLISPGHRRDAVERFRERLAGEAPTPVESVLLRADGERVPISVTSVPIEHEGRVTGVVGIVQDLSERHRESDALRESEQRFRGSFESAAVGMALVAPDGRFLEANRAFCDLVGYTSEEMAARTFQEITHPDDLDLDLDHVQRMLSGDLSTYQMEKRYFHARGGIVWVLLSVSLVRSADGEPLYFVSQVQDITARKSAMAELAAREAQLVEAQQLAKLGGWEHRFGTDVVTMSPELMRIYGVGPDSVVTPDFLRSSVHPDDVELVAQASGRVAAPGTFEEVEFRFVLPGGEPRWLYSRSEAILENGEAVGKRGIAQDITERKAAEERFHAAELRYRTLVEQLPLAMYIRPLDMAKPNIYVSPQVEPMLGYPVEEWLTNPDLLAAIVHPDDRERVITQGERVRRGGAPVHDEYRYLRPDGTVVWVLDETHLVLDERGEPLYVQGFVQDITERKSTETERDRLRDELVHAQKLEALGRLAGGVAHDFNNMLTAIKGYSELLVAKLDPRSPGRQDANSILRAAEQASDLPRQLLAFGRKQVLEPTVVNLNDVVSSVGGLLDHVISDSITVEIAPGAASPWAFTDRSMLEHALVNLALNASDAMPTGGRLTIATGNATIDEEDASDPDARPGSYVVVRVADTGTGMDDETRRRAFEPFFTTKPPAGGSGLGLSSVYGTVTQSGGFVLLDTEVGQGSVFSLHLPVAAAPDSVQRRAPTILLAEDEEIVRDLTEQILASAGYRVLSAADGAEALALYDRHSKEIAGVVTDLVMPNMGGRALAGRLREQDGELPIVFISGHNNETPESLQLGTSAALLQKPYSLETLVATVGRLVPGVPLPEDPDRRLANVVADGHVIEPPAPALTPREREVLSLVADGLTNDKVAATLDISPETVQSHVRHAMVKLEADSRTEAVARALRHALID